MKTKRSAALAAAALALAVALTACRNPLASVQKKSPAAPATGYLAVNIRAISPRATAILSGIASKSAATARAYLAADKLHLTLLKGVQVVGEWDQTLDPAQDAVTGSPGGESGTPASFSTTPKVVGVGQGYDLEVALYNSASDPASPVVAGRTAEPFDVTTGTRTDVSIICTPANPTILTAGQASDEYNLETPWVLSADGGSVVSVGSELWFEVTVDGSSPEHYFTVSPSAGGTAVAGFAVYSEDGSFVAAGGLGGRAASGAPVSASLPTPQGTYYIGVLGAEVDAVVAWDGHFTVDVENPPISNPSDQAELSNVRRGLMLVNSASPSRLCYLWLDGSGALHSIESGDGGLTWGGPYNVSESDWVVDFAADIDSHGNTVALWITDSDSGGGASYASKAFGDSAEWTAAQPIVTQATVGSPSVFRAAPDKLVFGVGDDFAVGASGNGHSLYWNGSSMSGPYAVERNASGPYYEQIWADSSGKMYYLFADGHWSDGYTDIGINTGSNFDTWTQTDERIVRTEDNPDDANAYFGYLFKTGEDKYVVVYGADAAPAVWTLMYEQLSIDTLHLLSPAAITAPGGLAPAYSGSIQPRSYYALQAPDGTIHVVWNEPSESGDPPIKRAKITIDSSGNAQSVFSTDVGPGTLDGVSFRAGLPDELIISAHNSDFMPLIYEVREPWGTTIGGATQPVAAQ